MATLCRSRATHASFNVSDKVHPRITSTAFSPNFAMSALADKNTSVALLNDAYLERTVTFELIACMKSSDQQGMAQVILESLNGDDLSGGPHVHDVEFSNAIGGISMVYQQLKHISVICNNNCWFVFRR